MPKEADAHVTTEVGSALLARDPNALRSEDTFRGTHSKAIQALMADETVPAEVKRYLSARQAAGDESIPYQLFQQDSGTM